MNDCIDPMCACRGGPCAACAEGQEIAARVIAGTRCPHCRLDVCKDWDDTSCANYAGFDRGGEWGVQ